MNSLKTINNKYIENMCIQCISKNNAYFRIFKKYFKDTRYQDPL